MSESVTARIRKKITVFARARVFRVSRVIAQREKERHDCARIRGVVAERVDVRYRAGHK